MVEVCENFEAIAARTQASVTRTTHFLGNQGSGKDERVDMEALIETSRQTLETLLDRLGQASDKSATAVEKLQAVELARENSQGHRRAREFSDGKQNTGRECAYPGGGSWYTGSRNDSLIQ